MTKWMDTVFAETLSQNTTYLLSPEKSKFEITDMPNLLVSTTVEEMDLTSAQVNIFIQNIEKLSFQMTKRGGYTTKRPGRVNNPGRVKHSTHVLES